MLPDPLKKEKFGFFSGGIVPPKFIHANTGQIKGILSDSTAMLMACTTSGQICTEVKKAPPPIDEAYPKSKKN